MGACKYCGQSAGWFSDVHTECRRKRDSAIADISSTISAFLSGKIANFPKSRVDEIYQQGFIEQRFDLQEKAISEHIDAQLRNGVIDEHDERILLSKIGDIRGESDAPEAPSTWELELWMPPSLNDEVLAGYGLKLLKNAVLRDVLAGQIPRRVVVTDPLPFALSRDEHFIWGFTDVAYYEYRNRREFVGGSHGVSVRIMKGIYYRVGASRGTAVNRDELIHRDTGLFSYY